MTNCHEQHSSSQYLVRQLTEHVQNFHNYYSVLYIYINQILLFSRNAQLGSALKFVLLQLNALISSDRQRAAGAHDGKDR